MTSAYLIVIHKVTFYYHKEPNEDGEGENEGEDGSGEATADDGDYYYYEDYTK